MKNGMKKTKLKRIIPITIISVAVVGLFIMQIFLLPNKAKAEDIVQKSETKNTLGYLYIDPGGSV